jgi:hypothetical protein
VPGGRAGQTAPEMRVRGAALLFAIVSSSCVGELEDEGPCTPDGECLVGYECISNFCFRCENGGCGGLVHEPVDAEAREVCGPDEVCVSFPEGAIAEQTEIYIRRSPVEVPAEQNLERRSLVYEIGPASLRLRAPATVKVRISPSYPIDTVSLYRAAVAGGVWSPIETDPGPEISRGCTDDCSLLGTTGDLGFFVAARRLP